MRIAMQQHLEPVRNPMQSAAGLASAHAGSHSGTAQPRLVKAAHEFEAQLMKELMKLLTSGGAPGDDEDDDDDRGSGLGSAGALGEYASESLAQALSLQGGFGIANKIIKQLSHRDLSREGNETEAARAAGNERDKTKIKPLK